MLFPASFPDLLKISEYLSLLVALSVHFQARVLELRLSLILIYQCRRSLLDLNIQNIIVWTVTLRSRSLIANRKILFLGIERPAARHSNVLRDSEPHRVMLYRGFDTRYKNFPKIGFYSSLNEYLVDVLDGLHIKLFASTAYIMHPHHLLMRVPGRPRFWGASDHELPRLRRSC